MTENEQKGSSSIWSRNLITAMLCALCIGMSGQMLNPTFPLHLVSIGIDQKYAGSMVTAFSIGAVVFRPIAGMLVDRFGRRKMAMFGSLIVTLSYVGYLFTDAFTAMLAIRVMQGIGFGMTNTSTGTIASDVIPKDRITEGIGYYALAGAVSMTIGPATGLWLHSLFPMEVLFGLGVGLGCLCLLSASTISYKENLKPKSEGRIQIHLFEKNALLPASMIFICSFSQVALTTFLALYGQSIGIMSVGGYFLLNSIGTISARLFAGRLARRLGEQKLLIGAIIITSTCQLMVSQLNGAFMLYCIAIIYGFGYGVLYPVTNALAIKNTPPQNRGAANATYACAFDFAALIGGLFWGVVSSGIGYGNMYLFSGALMFLAIPITFVYKKIYGFDH